MTLKINQLKREIKELENSKAKRKKKIEANRGVLDEATRSKRNFNDRVAQSQRSLFNRLGNIEGSFSVFYKKQYNDVLKKGDLDRATMHLNDTIKKSKQAILKNEEEIASINRKIDIKKRRLKEYQKMLVNMKGN